MCYGRLESILSSRGLRLTVRSERRELQPDRWLGITEIERKSLSVRNWGNGASSLSWANRRIFGTILLLLEQKGAARFQGLAARLA